MTKHLAACSIWMWTWFSPAQPHTMSVQVKLGAEVFLAKWGASSWHRWKFTMVSPTSWLEVATKGTGEYCLKDNLFSRYIAHQAEDWTWIHLEHQLSTLCCTSFLLLLHVIKPSIFQIGWQGMGIFRVRHQCACPKVSRILGHASIFFSKKDNEHRGTINILLTAEESL